MRLRATSLARTAYHEAGHVVLAHVEGLSVLGASIERDRDSLGRVFYRHGTSLVARNQANGRTRQRVDAFVVCYLAGAEAEAQFAGRRDREGAMADVGTATDFAGQVVEFEEEMGAYLHWLSVRAKYLVRTYWALIDGLAKRLLRQQTMTGREVAEVMRELSVAQRRRRTAARTRAMAARGRGRPRVSQTQGRKGAKGRG